MTRRRRHKEEGEESAVEPREPENGESAEEDAAEGSVGITELAKKTEDLMAKVGLALADIRIIGDKVTHVGDKVRKFEEAINDVNELADELDEKLEKMDETEAKLDKIIEESEEVKSRISKIDEVKSAVTASVEELKQQEQKNSDSLIQLTTASQKQRSEFQNLSEQSESISTHINELTARVDESYRTFDNFANLKDLLAHHSEEIQDLKNTLEDFRQGGGAASPELTDKLQSVAQVEGDTKLRLEEFSSLLDQKDQELKKSIAELNERVESDLAELAPLIEKVSESAGANVAQASEKIRGLEGRFDSLVENLKIDELKARIDTIASSLNTEEISQNLKELTEKMSENEQEFDTRLSAFGEDLMDEMSQQIKGTMQENQKDFDGKTETLSSSVSELKEKLQKIEQQLGEDLKKQGEGVENLREELKKAFEEHKEEGRELRDRLQGILDSSSGVGKNIEESEGKVEGLKTQIATALEKYESMAKTMEEAIAKSELNLEKVNVAYRLIDDMESKVRKIASPVDDLIERIEGFEELPVIGDLGFDLNDLLNVMIKHQASDLHIKEGSPPTVRLEGDLVPVGDKVLSEADCRYLVLSSLPKSQRRKLLEKKELDYAYSTPEARFRVNSFLQKGTVSAAFRMLRTEIPNFDDLHLPPFLKKLAMVNHGLVLVTGPAGCGKSTTLASIIDYVNNNRKLHVITIEDPIEFIHADKLSIVTQRELGSDTLSFAEALKSSLRQDPNVILIGEMRDAETILTAAIAAETGHLVLSTLHTPNTTQAIERIIDVFSGDQQKQFRLLLSTTLRAIISQRLLNRIDGEGRVPAVEIMVVTPTISSLILEGKTNEIYPLMVQGTIDGMQTFTASLTKLFEAGLISKEDALYHADQPTEFRLGIEGHTSGSASIPEDSLMSWL